MATLDDTVCTANLSSSIIQLDNIGSDGCALHRRDVSSKILKSSSTMADVVLFNRVL